MPKVTVKQGPSQNEKNFSWNSQNPCNIAYKEGSQIGDQIQKITCGDLKSEFWSSELRYHSKTFCLLLSDV